MAELKTKTDRHREHPRGAIDYFHWMCENPDGQWTVRTLVLALEELRVAVPADATVNLSGPVLYAQWQREVS